MVAFNDSVLKFSWKLFVIIGYVTKCIQFDIATVVTFTATVIDTSTSTVSTITTSSRQIGKNIYTPQK